MQVDVLIRKVHKKLKDCMIFPVSYHYKKLSLIPLTAVYGTSATPISRLVNIATIKQG